MLRGKTNESPDLRILMLGVLNDGIDKLYPEILITTTGDISLHLLLDTFYRRNVSVH